VAPLGSWLVAPSLLSAFAVLCVTESLVLRVLLLAPPLRVQYLEFGSLPHANYLGQAQQCTPTSNVGVRLQFTVYVFQFSFRRGSSVCLGAVLDYFLVWRGREAMHCV
jgi:hypothetical protein